MRAEHIIDGRDYYVARSKPRPWIEQPGERYRIIGRTKRAGERHGQALQPHLYLLGQRVSDDGETLIGEPVELHGTVIHGPWDACAAARETYLATLDECDPEKRLVDRLEEVIRERTGQAVPLTPDKTPRRCVRVPLDVLAALMLDRVVQQTPGGAE